MVAVLVVGVVGAATAQWLDGHEVEPATGPAAPIAPASTGYPSVRRVELDRLRRDVPPPAAPDRRDDIFSFGNEPGARATSAPRVPGPAAAVELPQAAHPPGPQLTLIGVAEHLIGGSAVRTAIVTDDTGEPRFLETGEPWDRHHRVTRIALDSVLLMDTRTNTVLRLTLW